jgi:methylaspartate mutase epsilon subunit
MQLIRVKNKRLTDEEFFRDRGQVLAEWPTGKDVDLEDGIAFHKSLPDSKVYARRLARAKSEHDTLISTYSGVPTIEGQLALVKYLVEEGGEELCDSHVDSFTRNHMFQKAADAVAESIRLGRPMLNGFPVPIHGVAGNRKLIQSYPVPSRMAGCSCDWRLNAEIAFAGGHNCICAGPFFPYFVYNRDTDIETSIRNWQYIYRLIGYYAEGGAPIVSRVDGVHAIMCPPSVGNACRILEALMGAEQGVKNISLDCRMSGNMAQDLADADVMPRLGREYLDKFGYKDVQTFSMCTSIQGRYPYDHARAYAVLSSGPLVAAIAGLQEVMIFSIDEAHEIPSKENNAASLRCGKMVINLYKGQNLGFEQATAVKTETRVLESEVRSIVDRVIDLGDGDVCLGSARAVESGVIDIPFATARGAARRVLGVRDTQGALRFLDHGNLPFSKEVIDFHQEKLAERGRKQGREISYEAVIGDILSISEGHLISC